MKTCTKCKIEKTLDCFSNDKTKRDGLRSSCKECRVLYREANKDKIKKIKREYDKEYRKKMGHKKKAYRDSNKEKIREYRKKYIKLTREHVNKYGREYAARRSKVDSLYRIKRVVRGLIKTSIKRKGYSKKTKTYQILGCTFEEVQQHLRDSFELNYGIPFNFIDPIILHIDHIIPMASATTEEEVIKLNHYTNLQYLLVEDNMEKSDKLGWSL